MVGAGSCELCLNLVMGCLWDWLDWRNGMSMRRRAWWGSDDEREKGGRNRCEGLGRKNVVRVGTSRFCVQDMRSDVIRVMVKSSGEYDYIQL